MREQNGVDCGWLGGIVDCAGGCSDKDWDEEEENEFSSRVDEQISK
jgi:hypothetical protein